jgi:trans-aconitate 2-methyltransferase
MAHSWDPERYLTYADERGRPFLELLARVDAAAPAEVVDLGCGPGNLTELLAGRWPGATITGLDSSPEMIARARADGGGRVQYDVADLRDWRPDVAPDVLISNATLQWVPGHLDLIPALLGRVRPGGWFAFQVPGNFTEPSHAIREHLATEEPYAEHLARVASPAAYDAATYLDLLDGLGCTVDAWETTYLHRLTGPDAVFDWISGTGARPAFEALEVVPALRASYEAELRSRLRAAYPAVDGRVLMPFRRVFVVARTPVG